MRELWSVVLLAAAMGGCSASFIVNPEGGRTREQSLAAANPVEYTMEVKVQNPWMFGMSGETGNEILAHVVLNVSEEQRKAGVLSVRLFSQETGKLALNQEIRGPAIATDLKSRAGSLPWGAYELRAEFRAVGNQPSLSVISRAIILPGGKQQIKVLNNFVSELMNARERGLLGVREISFMNPRDGWCFFSMEGKACVRLDGTREPILPAREWVRPEEAMQYLKAGRHTLRIVTNAEEPLQQLIVRSIPALHYYMYNGNPYIAPHGPYDWEFLKKYVLANVNVMVGFDDPREEHIRLWKETGRKWLGHAEAPYVRPDDPNAVEEVYKSWTESIGYRHHLMDGALADEFTSGDDAVYDVWRAAVEKLNANYKGKSFSPFSAGGTCLFGPDRSRQFGRVAIAGGGNHFPEYYLQEQATEEAAKVDIHNSLVQRVALWDEAIPGILPRVVAVLSYMSAPSQSQNLHPTTNFKVFMDMQMQALATDPSLFGLGGVLWYRESYSDAENIRWGSQLFRHYCIEGRTTRATNDPYALTQLENPDFDDGVRGWTLDPAAEGGIRAGKCDRFGYLQCRAFTSAFGNYALISTRNVTKPNVFRQTIKNLEPGHLYSMKMITGDYKDLLNCVSRKDDHAISISITGADILPGPHHAFQFAMWSRGHDAAGFSDEHPYWFNYHWRVFRANGTTAELAISDWRGPHDAGGPVGQELAYNFIEVQPYLEE